jgi:uncharacterized Fe-S center protein
MNHEATFFADDDALVAFLARTFADVFAPRDRIAVKLHMGEPGNPYAVDAAFARRVVSCLAGCGCDPFLFDTPVVYASPRGTAGGYLASAAERGFTKEKIGAPVVVSNRSVAVSGETMTFRLAADPVEADGVLLLSHVKGHVACGMGGAIKNVGMGCVAKETKGAIHEGGEPVYAGGCTQCGACVERCPTGNIVLEGDRPRFGITWCPGCSNCALVCPERAIGPRVALFDELLAEAAVLAAGRFKKAYAVNVLRRISRLCDCMADAGPIVAPDVGFVCAGDMITADAASLDLLARASGRADLFAEIHKHSPWEHVRAAARMSGRDATAVLREIG